MFTPEVMVTARGMMSAREFDLVTQTAQLEEMRIQVWCGFIVIHYHRREL